MAKKKPHIGRPKTHFPAVIDWGQTYADIAKTIGVSISSVQQEWARRHPTERKFYKHTPFAEKDSWQKYKDWDWTIPDTTLALRNGVSREWVRRVRRGLGLPPSRKRVRKPLPL